MPLAPLTVLVAAGAVILVGLAKGGLSGLGALATPLLALVLPPVEAAALLLPILLAQDAVSVWAFRREWDGWVLGWMLPGALAGVAGGWWFAAALDARAVMGVLGAITFVFGAWRLWAERGGRALAASTSPGWVGALFGVGTGFASQIAHAGGPPFQMWVAPRQLPHERFVGTGALLFAAVNWAKVPAYLALGAFTRPVLIGAAALLPLAIASTLAGVWLVRRIRGASFYRLVYALMLLLGARLVWEALA